MTSSVRFAVLGPVVALTPAGVPAVLGGSRPRAVLTALIADAGRVVSVDRLAERVWHGSPPASAVGTVRAYVSQLRRALDPEGPRRTGDEPVIVTEGDGYIFQAAAEEIDMLHLDLLVRQADRDHAAGRATETLDAVDEALALWRGEPFVDLDYDLDLEATAVALRERRLRALDLKAQALLAVGRTSDAAELAEAMVHEQPLRERYWGHLILATHRDGRTADALAAFQRLRSTFEAELGLDPGPELEALHAAVLSRDPSLVTPAPAAAAAVTEAPSDPHPEPGPPSPLVVGRERELEILDGALTATADRHGRVIVLEGEAGIGKSHLAEVVRNRAQGLGFQTTWAGAVEDLGAPPLWLWEQILSRLGRAVPSFDAGTGDPAADLFRLCQAVTSTLTDAGSDRPLLIVLDDIQWADAASLQTLRFLARHLAGVPILVLLTRRRGEAHAAPAVEATLAALARERATRRVTLTPFTPDEVGVLVDRRPGANAGPRPDAVSLHRRTAGNPFYLTELLRLIDEGSAIDQIPDTVRLVIEQRYLALPQATRHLLRLAALAGTSLDLEVLAYAAKLDPADLTATLEPALTNGLLRHDPSTWAWKFVHDITRDALTGRLGPRERARLHGVLADAVETVHQANLARVTRPGCAHLDDVAQHRYHAAHGAPDEAAFLACNRAADHARAQLAHDQAALQRERALALLSPADPRRHQTLLQLAEEHYLVHSTDQRFAELVGMLWAAAGDEAEKLTATAAIACAPRGWYWRGDRPTENASTISTLQRLLDQTTDPRHRVDLLGALAMETYEDRTYQGDADALCEEAVRIARTLDDVPLLGRALNLRAFTVWQPGDSARVLAVADEALRYTGSGLPEMTQFFARTHRSVMLFRLGRLDEYDDEQLRCRRLAARLSTATADNYVTYQRISELLLQARWDAATDLIESHYEQMSRIGYQLRDWARLLQLSWVDQARGRSGAHADELIALAERSQPMRSTAVLALAESGQDARAHDLLTRWRLDRLPEHPRWSVDVAVAELGECAVLLGTPEPALVYDALLPQQGQLIVNAGMRCGGPVDLVLAKLAHALGNKELAAAHRRDAGRYAHLPGFAHLFNRAYDSLA